MMKVTRTLSLILSLVWLSACSDHVADQTVTAQFAKTDLANLKPLVLERADHFDVESVSVTIMSDDEILSIYHGQANETGLMQAASLSKPVAAAGILMLMERKGVDINSDIRDRFTSIDIYSIEGGDQPLTVRQLLSHTAGATQSGYPGYRRGTTLPSSAEIIIDPPSRLVSAVELSLPKGEFSYAGGGYQLAQLLAEDVSGHPFDVLMRDILFYPIGMSHSTFTQPIEEMDIAPLTIVPANSARRFREGLFRPLKESWHDYPEQAAAGLWTTSSDYARFVDALLDAAAGRDSAISRQVASAMLTPVAPTNFGDGDPYGLGVMLTLDDQDQVVRVSHSGLNAGYRALFAANPQQDRIIVALSNAPGGVPLNSEIVDGLLENSNF
ncbi:MAG: serine hydrolase domain-containing protein [Pseudomonadota bacterium]